MFKYLTISLTLLFTLVSACQPSVLPTPASTDTPAATVSIATMTPHPATAAALDVISANTASQVELRLTLTGHGDRLHDLEFSMDSKYLASSSLDGAIKLWDTGSWQELYDFSMANAVGGGIAFSPDGNLFASADALWNLNSRKVLYALEQNRDVYVPGVVAFSPDGSLLAIALGIQPVNLWDASSGQVVRALDPQADDMPLRIVLSLSFSPDGRLLATGGGKGTVRLWNMADGQIVGTFQHGKSNEDPHVHGVAFSPNGSILASGGTDAKVLLWDVASGQVVHTLDIGGSSFCLAFSPDGSILATAGNGAIKLWDVDSGQLLRTLRCDDAILALAFSQDGTMLASGGYDKLINLWGVRK